MNLASNLSRLLTSSEVCNHEALDTNVNAIINNIYEMLKTRLDGQMTFTTYFMSQFNLSYKDQFEERTVHDYILAAHAIAALEPIIDEHKSQFEAHIFEGLVNVKATLELQQTELHKQLIDVSCMKNPLFSSLFTSMLPL